VRLSFDLELDFGKQKAGEQRVGLGENLAEAWAEKRRMEAAASENNKIIAAKFPKLWQSFRKKVENDIAEYNHHYGSSGQVAFISPSAEMFGAKRESHPGFSLIVSYKTPQVINIQRHMKGQVTPIEDYIDVGIAPNGGLYLSYNGEHIDEDDASNLLLFRHLKP
jgi:hypothetical protein